MTILINGKTCQIEWCHHFKKWGKGPKIIFEYLSFYHIYDKGCDIGHDTGYYIGCDTGCDILITKNIL